MFGINGGEAVVLLLVAALVVGPERLPAYAEQLARWVRSLRDLLQDTKQRVGTELGTEDVDWAALDPRRYDPRRIVRDALLDEPVRAPSRPSFPAPGRAAAAVAAPVVAGQAPYDDEAT